MTERAERLARPAAWQSIGRKSQIAANARPPVRCARPRPRKRGLLRVSLYSAAELLISAGCGLLVGPVVHQRAMSRWYSPARHGPGRCPLPRRPRRHRQSLRGHVAGLLGQPLQLLADELRPAPQPPPRADRAHAPGPDQLSTTTRSRAEDRKLLSGTVGRRTRSRSRRVGHVSVVALRCRPEAIRGGVPRAGARRARG